MTNVTIQCVQDTWYIYTAGDFSTYLGFATSGDDLVKFCNDNDYRVENSYMLTADCREQLKWK